MAEAATEERVPLWDRLYGTPRPSKVVAFPRVTFDGRKVGELAIVVLTQEEQMGAIASADKLARRYVRDGSKGDLGYDAFYAEALVVEILHRACREVDEVNRHAFPSTEMLRQQFDTNECAVLFERYVETKDEQRAAMVKTA